MVRYNELIFKSGFLLAFLFAFILIFSSCNQQDSGNEVVSKIGQESNSNNNSAGIDSTHHFEQIKYSNGKVKMEGNLENGLREGKWTAFYEDGMIWSETHFLKGQKQGATTTWYPSGIKRYEGFYNQNRESGIWKFYDENGKQVQEKKYQ